MNQTNNIKDLLNKALETRTQPELFGALRGVACPRTALMIIDSAMKGMSLLNLHNTLLIRKDRFDLELQNATIALEMVLKND